MRIEDDDSMFLIKMAISSNNEIDLMNFISSTINDDEQAFSFENILPICPQILLLPDLLPSHVKLKHMLNLRLENWGVIHDCENIKKIVLNGQLLFGNQHKYTEYLQFTCKLNVPLHLFKICSLRNSNLRFDLVYIENGLTVCGRTTFENGQIINHELYTNVNENALKFLLFGSLMYDGYDDQSYNESFRNFRASLLS